MKMQSGHEQKSTTKVNQTTSDSDFLSGPIKAWLKAMTKLKRIKEGGRLVFQQKAR